MADESEVYRVDKILSSKARPVGRAYIDEKNLQIQLKETAQQDPAHSFSKIIGDINNAQVSETRIDTSEQMIESHKLNSAMEQTRKSLEAMMEFHNQVRNAYEQLVEMK